MKSNKRIGQVTCLRCEHTWFPHRLTPPKNCPKCNSPYWAKPRELRGSLLELHFETQLKQTGNNSFEREYKFCHERKFKFDFADKDIMVAIEIEGGTWSGGRHTTGSGFAADCRKYNLATSLGWKVFRFTGEMVKSGEAVNFICDYLKGGG